MTQSLRPVSKRVLSSLLLSAALAACTVGPDYSTPKMELKPFHNQADASTPQAHPAPPLDRWWTGFNDPMLVPVVQRALSQNLDLAAALARVPQARAAAAGSGAALLPTVDLGASTTFEHQSLQSAFGSVARSAPGFKRDVDENVIGPSASWEIDLFGGLRRSAAASRDEAEAAEADQAGIRVTVAADTADAYLQVRGYQARLAVTEKQIATDQHLVQLVRNRYATGSASEREIAQAEALLKQARGTVPPLRLALEQQLNRLDILMGAQPGTNLPFSEWSKAACCEI
jgi:NodT family efflux transporter outer membrane factor (OMF) lipoprotein